MDALVAVLRQADVSDVDTLAWLSDRERTAAAALRSARRRQEWIAARLAAKYLFLGAPRPRASHGAGWRPRLVWVTRPMLDTYPAWAYRCIDVAVPTRGTTGVPRLTWRAEVQAVHVSLAHQGGYAAACLDWRAPIGIDVERIERRSRIFRDAHFSDAERDWAEGPQTDCDRAYTLLWCIKESALKAQERDAASVWHLPGVELCAGGDASAWTDALAATAQARAIVVPATVQWSQARRNLDVFVAADGDLLFTAVRLQEKVA
jgi:4'-phosphopantetheinyl transferase EntD